MNGKAAATQTPTSSSTTAATQPPPAVGALGLVEQYYAAHTGTNKTAAANTASKPEPKTDNKNITTNNSTNSTTTTGNSTKLESSIKGAGAVLKSTTATLGDSVQLVVNELIVPKSKLYIWHRTQGTAKPYPLQPRHQTILERVQQRRQNKGTLLARVQQQQQQRRRRRQGQEEGAGEEDGHHREKVKEEERMIDEENNNNNNTNHCINHTNNHEECCCDHTNNNTSPYYCDVCADLERQLTRRPCFMCYAPLPVYYCANLCEQNWCCDTFGKIGCFGHDDFYIRRRILLVGLVSNCLSFVLSLIACFSISLNFHLIAFSSFTDGLLYVKEMDLPLTQIWIGLRGIAIKHYKGRGDTIWLMNPEDISQGRDEYVLSFETMCDYWNTNITGNNTDLEEGFEDYFEQKETCASCASISSGLVITVIISTLLIIPSITTDVLRMYPNYDLNCQKCFGTIISLVSMIFSLSAWRGYANSCYRSFTQEDGAVSIPFYLNDGTIAYGEFGASILDDDDAAAAVESNTSIHIQADWMAGIGLICIAVATFLKIIDIVAIWLIPTPLIAHTRHLQDEYEELYGTDTTHSNDGKVHEDSIMPMIPNDKDSSKCEPVPRGFESSKENQPPLAEAAAGSDKPRSVPIIPAGTDYTGGTRKEQKVSAEDSSSDDGQVHEESSMSVIPSDTASSKFEPVLRGFESSKVNQLPTEEAAAGSGKARSVPILPTGTDYSGGTRKEQNVSSGVMERIQGLEADGLRTKQRMGKKMLTPRIITDVKETWDQDGNIKREMTHYIENIDGTKQITKETVFIPCD